MTNDKWKDIDIEELLEQAPKIHDTRSKDDVLSKLKEVNAFHEEESPQPIVKRKKNSFGIFIASAAIIFLTLIGAYLLKTQELEETQIYDTATTSMDIEEYSTEENAISGTVNESIENKASVRQFSVDAIKTAVYTEDIKDVTVFPIGLTAGAESIPMTFLIPNEQISDDFNEQPTQLQLYEKYASRINEQALGFDDYHPYTGRLTESGTTITHSMPDNHQYDVASATMYVYGGTLQHTFGKNYGTLVNVDESGKPITFDQAGEPSEPSQLGGDMLHYSYAVFQLEDGPSYLAPNNQELFDTVTEALERMPVEYNDVYQSAIIKGVKYEVKEHVDFVKIRFVEPLNLDGYNAEEAMRMLEAILLTAAGFNQQVRFENIIQSEWGGFNFNEMMPTPIGANGINMDFLQNN
ncbi:hypothetical protein [Solibacillus sp. FSL H8-0538]|uniref:hypothetical protein n=1 Tax=Solibacillus sp. FSL H8-0538 TaxID=2921400 RepID=UPI0030FAA197